MKRLNGEFDPLFKVVDDAKERAVRYLRDSTRGADRLVLVAAKGTKVLGVLRAEVKERLFYQPSSEGGITDFYVLPEWRRRALGDDMLQRASERLKKMGAVMISRGLPGEERRSPRSSTRSEGSGRSSRPTPIED